MQHLASQSRDAGTPRAPEVLRLLLVEDDVRTAAHLVGSLGEEGWRVVHVADGAAGHDRATEDRYDALVVDRMLPCLDGVSLVRAMRARGDHTPVLFLTTMSGIDDRIEGLEAGGDDYLVKPFAHGELVARIKALVRRARRRIDEGRLRVADLEVDADARRLWRAGRPIDLQPREFELLEYLVRHAGDVVTRRQLLEAVWDFRFVPQTNIVESHMCRLRAKMDRGFDQQLIETIRGVGYRMHGPVA